MADETSPKSLTQIANELGLQSPGSTFGFFSALITPATPNEADYESMLANLSVLTGQSQATIAAYVERYLAQWITKPEPAPSWRNVEFQIAQKVSSGEPIYWYGEKPDLPMFR